MVRRKLTLRKFPSPLVGYSLHFALTKAFQMLLELLFIKKKFACRKGKFCPIFSPKQEIENSIMGWFQEICCAFYA